MCFKHFEQSDFSFFTHWFMSKAKMALKMSSLKELNLRPLYTVLYCHITDSVQDSPLMKATLQCSTAT